MREFTTVQLLRDLTTVTMAASREPVAITQHRKPRYVLMSLEDFEKLNKTRADPRRAYRSEETPEAMRQLLLAGLDEILADRPDDDG